MKRFTIFKFALFYFLLFVPGALGDTGISIKLDLDRTETTLTDSIRMVVRISGSRDTESEPVIKGLENFTVRQGGTASRVEIINGRVNAGLDYTYYLQPKETGAFQIGPAEVTIDDKRYQSQPRSVGVTKPVASPGSNGGALFLKTEISSKEIYVEEQAVYVLKLYNRGNIRDISLSLPEHDHLVFKQLGKPREYGSTLNGQNYEVLEVRYTVVANETGTHVIRPARMNMTVLEPKRRSRRNAFDNPFFRDPFFSFSSGRPVSLSGEPIEMAVQPLPEAGKPKNFSGLIGQFKIESQLAPASVKAGESATLTVQVKGQGNVQRIPDLKFPELEAAKIYADQPVLNVEQDENGIGGVKTMKWALVPEKRGPIEVPSLVLSYFDPQKRAYQILKTTPYLLSVLPAAEENIAAAPPSTGTTDSNGGSFKQEIKALGRDILPIHTAMKNLVDPAGIFKTRMLPAGLILGPLFLYLIAFLTLKLRKRTVDTLIQTKSKKAAGELAKQCRQAELSHQNLLDALREYLNSRFALSLGVLSAEEAAGILRSNGVDSEATEKLCAVVQAVENAVYTGKGHEETNQAETLTGLVKAMEKEIR